FGQLPKFCPKPAGHHANPGEMVLPPGVAASPAQPPGDEHGYLRSHLAEASQLLGVAPERVERVLAQLQTLDPPGIGARTVRECLLLHLRALEAEGQPQSVALAIVDRFLNDLSRGHYMQIAHQLGLTRREVEQAHAFIQRELTPFPAQGYLEG